MLGRGFGLPMTPSADIGSLIDDFVGAGEQRRRHGQSERLCGFEVDRKLEFGRLQEWQVGWLRALKNAADIDTRLIILIRYAGAIADQASGFRELPSPIDCGYAVECSERHKNCAPVSEQRVIRHH